MTYSKYSRRTWRKWLTAILLRWGREVLSSPFCASRLYIRTPCSLMNLLLRMTVHDHLDAAAERTKVRIQLVLYQENTPATLNTHYFSTYRDKFLAFYKGARDGDGIV